MHLLMITQAVEVAVLLSAARVQALAVLAVLAVLLALPRLMVA